MKRRTLLKLLVGGLAATACAPVPQITPTPEARSRSERSAPTAVPIAAAAEVKHGDWFKLKPESARRWTIVPTPGDVNQIDLRQRGRPEGAGPAKRVLVLYTRASSSYDTAINRVLSVLLEKRIPAEVTVKNITRDPAVGQQGLAFARAGGLLEHDGTTCRATARGRRLIFVFLALKRFFRHPATIPTAATHVLSRADSAAE